MVAAADHRLLRELRRPGPNEEGWAKLLHGRYSATFLEALVCELVIRKELLPEGAAWLDDIEAERMALYGMGAGLEPPSWLSAADFCFGFHKYLYDFLRLRRVTPEDALDADKIIALLLIAHKGGSVLEVLPTAKERRRATSAEQVNAIDAIAEVGMRKPQMLFSYACERVHKLAVRRRAHHRSVRLLALLEQATVDPKELWKEHRGIGELLTELTGSDGKVDGW
jgi:hypothetical protein